MLVEDTTAFNEQLEVRREGRRAEKHRRRRAHAEVALLSAQWEARLASHAARKLEDELAALSAAGAANPGRRLLRATRRRSLEHDIATLHARARAKQKDVGAIRERLRRLDENGVHDWPSRGAKTFRLHSAEHHLECSERRFARLARSQADLPVLVASKEGRSWWWYLDRFWWDDQGATRARSRSSSSTRICAKSNTGRHRACARARRARWGRCG